MNQELKDYLSEIAVREVEEEKHCSQRVHFMGTGRVNLARELLEKFAGAQSSV